MLERSEAPQGRVGKKNLVSLPTLRFFIVFPVLDTEGLFQNDNQGNGIGIGKD